MGKFKIGDRVRAIVNYRAVKAGSEHIVDYLDEDGDVWLGDANQYLMTDSELELVPAWTPKVGDRVLMTNEVDSHKADCGATVAYDRCGGYKPLLLKFDERQSWGHSGHGRIAYGFGWWVSPSDIEPFVDAPSVKPSKFKVGDRVVTEDDSTDIGVVTKIEDGDYAVRWESAPEASGNSCVWNEDDLLPAAAALKIETGRYYKTRDGRKVGPMRAKSHDIFVWTDGVFTWADDGLFWYEPGNGNDLVALWEDKPIVAAQVDTLAEEYGPVVPAAPAYVPKFKVGDLVDYKDSDAWSGTKITAVPTTAGGIYLGTHPKRGEGGFGESWIVPHVSTAKFKVGDRVRGDIFGNGISAQGPIVEIDEHDKHATYRIDIGFRKPWLRTSTVTLLVELTSAIVCLIENGQPKPATRPFVHTSTDGAEKEAKRLAGVHKGQQFGVYVLTGEPALVEKTYEHEWQRQAANGNKINAIRELRGITGMGLKPAKDAVEYFLALAA